MADLRPTVASGEDDTFLAMSTLLTRRDRPFAEAIENFLSQPDLARSSVTTYRRILERLFSELEQETSRGTGLTELDLELAVERLWSGLSPASWNRNLAALRSFLRWGHRHRYFEEFDLALDRRRDPAGQSRAIPQPVLEALWRREDIALREKAIWRLLYETAARSGEILALDIDDLDLSGKRARIRSKGGDLDVVHFQSGSARLLPRLLAGRQHGPVFLTERSAPLGTPSLDVCPLSGRARLSYRRAAALFADHTGGWTLHQLRHSAITHLAENGVSTTLLMAKSRHRSLRTLQRYARPGPEAVAALTAAHDPARRRP